MNIFTYGTLQSNESRKGLFEMFGGKFLGNAKIKGMKIYHVVSADFPVVFTSNTDDEVYGEIYFVEDEVFYYYGLKEILDQIEGTGTMYQESKKTAELVDTKEKLEVILYEGIPSFWGYEDGKFIKNPYFCVNVTKMGKWSADNFR